MAVGLRTSSPSLSAPNINEASRKDIAASLHKNVLSWGVWRGPKQKESVSLRAITHSARSQTADRGLCRRASNLFRTASVPDVVGRNPKTAFSSITIAARKVLPSLYTTGDPVYLSSPTRPAKISTAPKETIGRSILSSPTRVPNLQLDICRQNHTKVTSNASRQASSTNVLAMKDPERRRVQLDGRNLSFKEGDRKKKVIEGSLNDLSSQPSYKSCVHLQVPLRSAGSFVFLDKSLCISLMDLEGRRAGQPTLFRSTFSVRLHGSSYHRSPVENKPAKTNLGCRRSKTGKVGHSKGTNQDSYLGHCRGPLMKHQGSKVEQIAPAQGVNSKADDSDTQRCSATSGLLSFRGPNHSNTKAGRQKENADEAAFPVRSNFKQRHHTFNIGTVDSRIWIKQPGSESTEEHQEQDGSTGTESKKENVLEIVSSKLQVDSLVGTAKTLSLKEALELFRPDFISRSQGRVKRLEQRALRRRALQDTNPDLVQDLREDGCRQRRKCTTPDPLSDNLFKPRERSISGREMQLRSRRIYNKLPEVTKKKEEEKKKAVSQSNRQRAEVFKKRLLDQILQR